MTKDKQAHLSLIQGTILPSLEKMIKDEDNDVRYFAQQSLDKCNELLK